MDKAPTTSIQVTENAILKGIKSGRCSEQAWKLLRGSVASKKRERESGGRAMGRRRRRG
jgi:hypothetical protein